MGRPGRFDKKIKVSKPGIEGRKAILKVYSRKTKLSPTVNLGQIARDTAGFFPAGLSNVFNEASLEAIRRISRGTTKSRIPNNITKEDIYSALDRIEHGVKRDSISKKSWLTDIYSSCEAGKTIVSTLLRDSNNRIEKLIKVSVVTRSQENSFTTFAKFESHNYLYHKRGKLINKIRILCAGRAAEEVLFGSFTTQSLSGIISGLRIARQLVYQFGLSDLGVLSFTRPVSTKPNKTLDIMDETPITQGLYLGEREFNNKTRHKMESAALLLLLEGYLDAKNILEAHQEALLSLASSLNKHKEITASEIKNILEKDYSKNVWNMNKSNQTLFISK